VATYTLFSQGATGATLASDTSTYTLGVEFSVSSSGYTLDAVWFYSASGATDLPVTIGMFEVTGGTLVHSESASWSGAGGSGWVKASFSSPPSLTSGTNYKAVVFHSTAVNWYAGTSFYWSSGAGSGGITNGVLSAPNDSGATPGQDSYATAGSISNPNGAIHATNYWVDPEVTSGGTPQTATAALTVTPAFAVKKAEAHVQAATITPAFAVKKAEAHKYSATITPVFSALGVKNFGKGGTPDRHHRKRSW
jgi:Domain of unknown function (DUF4082)